MQEIKGVDSKNGHLVIINPDGVEFICPKSPENRHIQMDCAEPFYDEETNEIIFCSQQAQDKFDEMIRRADELLSAKFWDELERLDFSSANMDFSDGEQERL